MSPEERLERLRPLVGIMAREQTVSRPHLYDDAVQEGLVAAWKVLQSGAEVKDGYLTVTARRAIADVVHRGRPFTGEPSHRGRQDAADRAVPLVAPAAGDGEDVYTVEPADPSAAADLERVVARVDGAPLWEAVADLEHRDRVLIARVAAGDTWSAAGAAVGMKSEAARRRFRDHLAPYLREAVA